MEWLAGPRAERLNLPEAADPSPVESVTGMRVPLRVEAGSSAPNEGARPAASEPSIIGDAPALGEALRTARRFAQSELSVLLVGETGTGKEVFAQEIHRSSRRRGAFVDVNCAALPRDMVEALLFGHRRGAFTGALEHARGLVEDAEGGTLFLDEVLSLPDEGQAKLLRVLETGEVRRVGETSKRRISFRTVAAAQPDVYDRVAAGEFRADLLQRLAGVVIVLPALRDRIEDVMPLARHFAAVRSCTLGLGAADVLEGYGWPGNVRELRLVVERACILSDEYEVAARILSESINLGAMLVAPRFAPLEESPAMPRSVRDRVLAVCAANEWNAEQSARALGLGRTTFFKRLKELGIALRTERTSLSGRLR